MRHQPVRDALLDYAVSQYPDPLRIAGHLQERLQTECSAICLLGPHPGSYRFLTRYGGGLSGLYLASGGTYFEYTIETGAPLVVRHHRGESRATPCSFMRAEHMTAYLGVPIFNRAGRAIGCLSLLQQTPRLWRDEDVALARRYGDLTAKSFEKLASMAGRGSVKHGRAKDRKTLAGG